MLVRLFATLGPIGHRPFSGTWASLLTLPIIYGLSALDVSIVVYSGLIIGLVVAAWYAIEKSLAYFKHHDPRQIVIDEVVGCMVTFVAVPISFTSLAMGFVLFRLFDITKMLGIKKLESIRGPWGILLDDIAAGLLSNVILQLVLHADLM
ncbi:MAG: phosphatidylglycerophosphatase A [Candidatus Dependentiae bacterium]|nr:phosphatidylglycerophosphatase A [Candidatus Dependentiae bacterium]